MDIVGYRVREGKVQKKKTSTLQEQISFNEVRRGSSQISEPLHLSKKSMYVQAYMWNSTVIRGLFFSKVVPSSYLLNGWGKEFWRYATGWTGWELGKSTFMSIFFLWVREFFVLHRMVGRIQRGV